MKPKPNLLIVTGPTASGKSSLALELCERLNGEIVSCDSMQIYRGCDIATAKPTSQERAQVPHHLLDICDPSERFSAAQWAARANETIADIEARGKTPLVCGGTGFYLRALLQPEILAEVEPNEELRNQLSEELAHEGAEKMHEKLRSFDPAAADRLHPNDTFRVLRAIEVAILRPEAGEKAPPEEPYNAQIFGLDWPREVLYERINQRVDLMLVEGALDELRTLREHWGADAPALGGVGYKQMMPALEDPARISECVEDWKRDTRRFAKRQMTWFRHQLNVKWLDPTQGMESMVKSVVG